MISAFKFLYLFHTFVNVQHESGINESNQTSECVSRANEFTQKLNHESGINESNRTSECVSLANEFTQKFNRESGINESNRESDYECVTSSGPRSQNKCPYDSSFDSSSKTSEVYAKVSKHSDATSSF